jgi:hypothetical protein
MLDFEVIEYKLKELLKIEKDYQLVHAMGYSAIAYASRKNRESIPFYAIIKLCNKNNLDLNYVFKER